MIVSLRYTFSKYGESDLFIDDLWVVFRWTGIMQYHNVRCNGKLQQMSNDPCIRNWVVTELMAKYRLEYLTNNCTLGKRLNYQNNNTLSKFKLSHLQETTVSKIKLNWKRFQKCNKRSLKAQNYSLKNDNRDKNDNKFIIANKAFKTTVWNQEIDKNTQIRIKYTSVQNAVSKH